MSGGESNNKREKTPETLCRIVAKGISNIVRFSMNEQFRKESFEALGVQSSNDVENEIYKRLITSKEPRPVVSIPNSNDNRGKSQCHENVEATSSLVKRKCGLENEERQTTLASICSKNWLSASIEKKKNMNNNISFSSQKLRPQFYNLVPKTSENVQTSAPQF